MDIKIGDLVTRNSYNNDVVFIPLLADRQRKAERCCAVWRQGDVGKQPFLTIRDVCWLFGLGT